MDEQLIDKIERISAELCSELTRLPFGFLVAHTATVFDKAGVPRVNPIPEEYFDAVLYGIFDEIYGGLEPEFDTEEEYNRFTNAVSKLKSAEYMIEEYEYSSFWNQDIRITPASPYQDKSIPFLAIRKHKKQKIYGRH